MNQKNNEWSLALVHGIPGVIQTMDRLAREICPGVTIYNLLNEGLFVELCKTGIITPSIMRRLSQYIASAEDSGASAILVTGSTFSPAVDIARKMVSIPILKIDEAMAEEAVNIGINIGLIATTEATIKPSSDLIHTKARETGREVKIIAGVCPEASLLLRQGKIAEHDLLVIEKVKELGNKVDVIILAQASMYSALAAAKQVTGTPIYASPELAIQMARKVLVGLGWSSQG